MQKVTLVAISLATSVLVGLGVNYYLWLDQTKEIEKSLVKIEQNLAKKNMKFTYDTLGYNGVKSWDVQGTLNNVKLVSEKDSQPMTIEVKQIVFKQDKVNKQMEFKISGEILDKITTLTGEENFKIILNGNGAKLVLGYGLDDKVNKLEYSDSGLKLIDNSTQKEIASSDSTSLSFTSNIDAKREKLELLFSSKNNKFTNDPSKNQEFAEIFKDVPDLGGHDYALNLLLDLPENASASGNPMMLMNDFKLDIRELKHSNAVFSIGIDGKLDGTTKPMPSGNINLVLGHYEKIIDIMFSIYKNSKKTQYDPSMMMNLKAEEEQIVKLKALLSRYKINDTDLKMEFVATQDGNMTISGKPAMEVSNEFAAIFAPPAPQPVPMPAPGAAPVPNQDMPKSPVITEERTEPIPGTAPAVPMVPEAKTEMKGQIQNEAIMPSREPMKPRPDMPVKPAEQQQ